MTTKNSVITDIFDLMLPINHRLKLLSNMDKENQFETVKRLLDIYRLSGVKKLEKFFIHICIFNSDLNLYLKQEILYTLYSKVTTKNKQVINRAFSNTIFLILQDAFNSEEYWLMLKETLNVYTKENKESVEVMLKNIIILGFKKLRLKEPFKKIFNLLMCFKTESYFMLLCTFIFEKYSRILSVKNNLLLLQIIFEEDNNFKVALFHIIEDFSVDLNLKLEACDILYLKGSENIKLKVQNILKKILPDSAYSFNPENVHIESMVTSVDRTLSSLLNKNKGKKYPLNLQNVLLERFSSSPEFDKIQGSLNRIFNYNFLKFSKYKLTLKDIIENVCLLIDECNLNLKTELYVRLRQELIDMYDTCSQGYVTRLINVFSGFEIKDVCDLGITLSYEDEIYAIFSNKINNVVQNAPEAIKDQLIEELMVPSNDYENRLTLTRYLRPLLPNIWNEIFDLFKDDLTITDLDLYCRKVTMRYEGV